MYLKSLKAHGFKSFADKTNLEFEKGINGIVGPNGSGKSNVVDAIRWVLGEQSVKSLRGDGTMTDVIFSGSKSRNAMNVASVSLTFDNLDHYLPLDYDEVEVKRRVYKDGTNEYFLNGERVRLKDLTNLLLDSGIAKESFNIISQGKIESIIYSKPADRRIIFEEASGVLKYKRRKEEAIKKLDKTHDNKKRINDILKELEDRLNPLKEARDKALEYNEVTKKLENLEIALITEDITNINFDYQNSKDQIDSLNEEVLRLMTTGNQSEAKIEKYRTSIASLDEQIKAMQDKILELTTLAERLNSKKILIQERQKNKTDDSKLHQNILDLKERELATKNSIEELKGDIHHLTDELNKYISKIKDEEKNQDDIKQNKNNLEVRLTNLLRESNNLEFKIENLQNSIENGGALPLPVRSVLNNPKLRGIHNALGNLIETDEKYALAITTSLGYNTNNIIVDDEKAAKEAINYLKTIGRATFFPLNVIKPKYIDNETLNKIKGNNGYIDIASNLVKYDSKYTNIILNQLGNIIVTKDIDSATNISRQINNRYRIVTLDGEIIHVGGSMTGGKQNKARNVISDKYELENNLKQKDLLFSKIKDIENEINEIDYNLKATEDKIYLLNKDKMLKEEEMNTKKNKMDSLKLELEQITFDINSNNKILNGGLSDEEEEILDKYYAALKTKTEAEQELSSLNREKQNLNETLEDYEASLKKENSLYSSKSNELKDLEIKASRLEVKLDNLLNTLTETYSMTYEKAKENYKLDIDFNLAKSEVGKLKKKVKDLGIVNLTAPEEYEEVNERYTFLNKQIEDLNEAENTLLEIIDEMDKVMISEFSNTFKTISANFSETFRELFKGGHAELKLTEPNNILETGIDIVASPPGKKLSSITLLSGGEKTLTAISLLFAIIKSKPSPFCVLDEVEAALDEANVDTFGQYVQKLKDKSEFIIITHKKKTMEYADILYGITMQESGVSKLVSVKLEDIE